MLLSINRLCPSVIVFIALLLTDEAMTSGGLWGTYLSTSTNDCASDEASTMFPNPPFVIAFIGVIYLFSRFS